jgi:phosphopantothenoylcysteine decarboxylase/phosphopantothenate--cysteine ligase
MPLKNKTIIVGITGGIAAYKIPAIVSYLKKKGGDVWVVLTENAQRFVACDTLRTLSKNPVITDLFSASLKNLPVPHISLSKKADIMIVAPATANIIGKAASGIADDALSTLLLSVKCPVIFAPAMNKNMWNNAIVKENVRKLLKIGHTFIPPEEGELACGEKGIGRLAPLKKIKSKMLDVLNQKKDLNGYKILITAGGTKENIDPVRFISNNSSGKMGAALARSASIRGAEVVFVTTTNSFSLPEDVIIKMVSNSAEMHREVNESMPGADILIMAAAVSDIKPKKVSSKKLKRNNGDFNLKFVPTEDILKSIGEQEKRPFLVGFCLEDKKNLRSSAMKKLKEKRVDMIVANPLETMGSSYAKIQIFGKDNSAKKLPVLKKEEVAHQILDSVLAEFKLTKQP